MLGAGADPGGKKHAISENVWNREHFAVADPGFPRGGCTNPKGGRQPTICLIFPENCMKMKKFWPRGGGARPWCPP